MRGGRGWAYGGARALRDTLRGPDPTGPLWYWFASGRVVLAPPLFRFVCLLAGAPRAVFLLTDVWQGNTVPALRDAVVMALWGWLWWQHRPPRNRRRKRAASRVVVALGRLRLVPT